MSRRISMRGVSMSLCSGACLSAMLIILSLYVAAASGDNQAASTQPTTKPGAALTVKGTCLFHGTKSTWSAKLTLREDGNYDAAYVSSWGGKPLAYTGQIKTDLKTQISGTGKASGGGANGTFEFSGDYGKDGIAKCKYSEVGGARSGTLTAELPQ